MFQCGDKIIYGIHGVCQVLGIDVKRIDGKRTEYYILQPMDQPGAKYFVPTQNTAALSKLRKIMTKQALEDLLASEDVRRDCWIVDENQRKQRYKELISGSDHADLIAMVRSLHKHKKEQLEAGRKFHLADENFLRDAQKLLAAEFSLVLGIPADNVGEYLQNKLDI